MIVNTETGEIVDSVPIPEETKKKPRARRAKKVEQSSAAASLLAALKFVSIAQKKAGTPTQQHCAISANWVAASNGVLMVAAKIEDDLIACPHTFQFIDALAKCGQELSITQLSETALSIMSDKFRAVVPCALPGQLELSAPDPEIAVIDDRIKAAFACIGGLATDGSPDAIKAAVLLRSCTAVATNGPSLMEYWHGVDLPAMLVPKASAVAICKAEKKLRGLGFSGPSATFYFEDDSFIKTQLYNERYPNYQALLNVASNPWPLPDDFFKAVQAVESFSKNGIVYFDDCVISSREEVPEATTYKVEGLPNGMGFNAKFLLNVKHAMQTAHFDKESNKVYFFGESVRGVLMGVTLKVAQAHEFEKDDIPF